MAKNGGGNELQDSTTKLPMVDLETALEAVKQIRDRAVENAAMPEVAKALKYANATSTPFYRRISSARLFNLLSQKSSLTQEAINYIKPHADGMQAEVLRRAVLGIPAYASLVAAYSGKKLNVELVKNSIAKDYHLSDSCALICAKVFETSLRFAGMLAADETVLADEVASNGGVKDAVADPPRSEKSGPDILQSSPPTKETADDVQEQTLYLDKTKARRCTVTVPLDVTRAEFDRICKWLEFAVLIDEKPQNAS